MKASPKTSRDLVEASMDETKSAQSLAPSTVPPAASSVGEGSPQPQAIDVASNTSSSTSKVDVPEITTNQTKCNEESSSGPDDAKRKGSRLQLAPASPADERVPAKTSSLTGAVWQPLDRTTLGGVTTKSKGLESPRLAAASEAEVGVVSECRVQPPITKIGRTPSHPGAVAVQGINNNDETGVTSTDEHHVGPQQGQPSQSNSVSRSISCSTDAQGENVEVHEQLNQTSRMPSICTATSTANIVTAELAIPVEQLVAEELISREQVLRRDIEHIVRKEVRESTVRAEAVVLSQAEPSRSRKMMMFGAFACIILLILVVGVVLGVSVAGNGSTDNKLRGGSQSVDPNYPTTTPFDGSTSPPNSASLDLRLQLFSKHVEKHVTMTNVGVLQDPQSPQFAALSWLAYEDPYVVDVASTPTWEIVERYVLAVLYFSTRGDGWRDQAGFLGPDSVCNWYGNATAEPRGVLECEDGSVTLLDVYANRLFGTIPAELASLSNLRALWIEENTLTGSLPSELATLSQLDLLHVFDNFISGTLPSEYGSNLPLLAYFDANANEIAGSIPTQYGSKSHLVQLALIFNQLTGTIPTEIGLIESLEFLDLQSNQLESTIPSELGQLENLSFLYLEENLLTGAIPSELGQLTKLQFLWLHANQLTGAVPHELQNLANNLTSLVMHNNGIVGSLDDVFCDSMDEVAFELEADCAGEEPQIECSCCSLCH